MCRRWRLLVRGKVLPLTSMSPPLADITSLTSDGLASALRKTRPRWCLVLRRFDLHPPTPCRLAMALFSPPHHVPVLQGLMEGLLGIASRVSVSRGRSKRSTRWRGVPPSASRLAASDGRGGLRELPSASLRLPGGAVSAAPLAAPPAAGVPPHSVFAARRLEPGVIAPEPGSSFQVRA